MEDHHRKMIKDNIDKLTSKTELNLLMNLCVKYKILSQIMKENLYKVSQKDSYYFLRISTFLLLFRIFQKRKIAIDSFS